MWKVDTGHSYLLTSPLQSEDSSCLVTQGVWEGVCENACNSGLVDYQTLSRLEQGLLGKANHHHGTLTCSQSPNRILVKRPLHQVLERSVARAKVCLEQALK